MRAATYTDVARICLQRQLQLRLVVSGYKSPQDNRRLMNQSAAYRESDGSSHAQCMQQLSQINTDVTDLRNFGRYSLQFQFYQQPLFILHRPRTQTRIDDEFTSPSEKRCLHTAACLSRRCKHIRYRRRQMAHLRYRQCACGGERAFSPGNGPLARTNSASWNQQSRQAPILASRTLWTIICNHWNGDSNAVSHVVREGSNSTFLAS